MTIRVEIVSQDRMVYEGNVEMITMPGIEGEMGVLSGHAPLITALAYGVIKVKAAEEEHVYTVAGGIVEVQPDIVTILADAAEDIDEINLERAQKAKQRAEDLLHKMPQQEKDTDDFLAIEAALRRSNLRIDAVQRFKRDKAGHPLRQQD